MRLNDGFNERMNYIQNSNNNRFKHNTNFDNSFGKMRSEERRNMVKTTNTDKTIYTGNNDNLLLRNSINNFNHKSNPNNLVGNALNRNKFKK